MLWRGVYALHVQTHLKRCVCPTCSNISRGVYVLHVQTHLKRCVCPTFSNKSQEVCMPYMFKHISRGVYALHVQTHLKRCVCLTCTKTHSSVTQVSTHTKEIFLFIYFVIQDQHSHLIKRLPSKIKLYLYQHWNGMPPTDRASETKRFCTTSN